MTGDWTAVVDEQMVEGPLSTTITAGVALSRRERPGDVVDVLGVDTGGHEDERPRISWTAPNILRVTVPNQSFLKILTRQVGDVRIDVRFDPDGPAARAAWLKRTDQPPD